MQGNGNGSGANGVNLAYTKFFFVMPRSDDETTRAKLRAAGGLAARGFFNDFEAEGRDSPPHETIQFLLRAENGTGAPYAMQVCSKYRPRLAEAELELRRRIAEFACVTTLKGAVRTPQYTSAQMHAYAYKPALPRASGRVQRNAIVIPMRKSSEWWDKGPLDRQTFFYPHANESGARVEGHARAAQQGIETIYRKLYYNPDGPGRDGEWDFVTYFECADEHLDTFNRICQALRDQTRNPEWRYVIEGPEWRGRRVQRW